MLDPLFLQSAANEVAGVQLGDARLNRRYAKFMARMSDAPAETFPKAMEADELEAFYRFASSDRVTPGRLFQPHFEATAKRMEGTPGTILAIHDTTDFTFSADGIRDNFHGHFSIAATTERLVLGILNLRCRRGLATAEKGSARWIKAIDQVEERFGAARARLLHVMDRESDDWTFFCYLVGHRRFIARGYRDRSVLLGEAAREKLEVALGRAQAVGRRSVSINARGKARPAKDVKVHPARKERMAHLSASSATVTLLRPKHASKEQPEQLTVKVVRVWEAHPPSGEKPVCWTLITTEPVETVEQLWAVVDAYRARWLIEEFNKALKTGTGYEKRQLEGVRSRLNTLAMLSVLAWKLLLLRGMARDEEKSSEPASKLLSPVQLKVLRIRAKEMRNYRLPAQPTIREAMLAVAAVGGHLKHNGEPGWQTLGAGLEKLLTLTQGWYLAKADLEM